MFNLNIPIRHEYHVCAKYVLSLLNDNITKEIARIAIIDFKTDITNDEIFKAVQEVFKKEKFYTFFKKNKEFKSVIGVAFTSIIISKQKFIYCLIKQCILKWKFDLYCTIFPNEPISVKYKKTKKEK